TTQFKLCLRSITCIICLTCVGSQLSINSSSARSFSGPVQLSLNTSARLVKTVHHERHTLIDVDSERSSHPYGTKRASPIQ
uniref:Secreted protein n=1 Tax=Oryzias latipes TaxID=8090 RepID=A0A3P9L3F7_ORYLA